MIIQKIDRVSRENLYKNSNSNGIKRAMANNFTPNFFFENSCDKFSLSFSGRKDYTENEKKFAAYNKGLSKKHRIIEIKRLRADWDFEINSSNKNLKKRDLAEAEYSEFKTDRNILKQLKKFKKAGIADSNLKQQVEQLITNYEDAISSKTTRTAHEKNKT